MRSFGLTYFRYRMLSANYFVISWEVPFLSITVKSNRKTMNRNWSNQKAKSALKTIAGNK